MFSLFEEDNSQITVSDLLKRFKVKWKTKPGDEIKCPHCRKLFRLESEYSLEDLLYTLDPTLHSLTETSQIPQELYDSACAVLRNDGLEK